MAQMGFELICPGKGPIVVISGYGGPTVYTSIWGF